MSKHLWYILLTAALVHPATSSRAATIGAETVTYADFGYVNHVAVSMKTVYFATTEGIIRYDKFDRSWDDPLTGGIGIDQRDILRVWVDQFDDNLIAQTSTGLYEYDLLFERWYPISEVPQLENTYAHVKIPDIMYAPGGFNYSAEGYLIDPAGRNFEFSDLVDDYAGNLWIGTWGYGAATAGASSHVIELLPFGLIQNRVNTIFDENGILWIGGVSYDSYRSGVTVFDVDQNSFRYIEQGIRADFPQTDINAIVVDTASVYIGTIDGLMIYDRANRAVRGTIDRRAGLAGTEVLALAKVGDSILVGTAGGLNVISLHSDSVRFIRPNQFLNTDIYDFATTDTTVWIASSIGAFQLQLATGALRKFQDPHGIIFSQAYNVECVGEFVWIVSDDGLLRVNLLTGETLPIVSVSRHYRARALAANDQIAAVADDRGLVIYFLDDDRVHNERLFTTDDGLPSNRIYSLLMDGDFLWIGTDKGLTRFLWNDPDRID